MKEGDCGIVVRAVSGSGDKIDKDSIEKVLNGFALKRRVEIKADRAKGDDGVEREVFDLHFTFNTRTFRLEEVMHALRTKLHLRLEPLSSKK